MWEWSSIARDAVGVLAGGVISGVITYRVARCYFRKAQAENTAMLRTFAIVQEQLAEEQLFMRDKDGQLDPSMAYKITGKGHGTLPMLEGHGKGTVGQKTTET